MHKNSSFRNLNNRAIYTSAGLLTLATSLLTWCYSDGVIITSASKALSIVAGLYLIQITDASSSPNSNTMESAFTKKHVNHLTANS